MAAVGRESSTGSGGGSAAGIEPLETTAAAIGIKSSIDVRLAARVAVGIETLKMVLYALMHGALDASSFGSELALDLLVT